MNHKAQVHLRGPEYGRLTKAAERSHDDAAAQAASFHDDDTGMGAWLLPFVVPFTAAISFAIGSVGLHATRRSPAN